MTVKVWKYSLCVCMAEVPSQDEKGLRVGCLLLADVHVQFTRCHSPVVVVVIAPAGGDIKHCDCLLPQ